MTRLARKTVPVFKFHRRHASCLLLLVAAAVAACSSRDEPARAAMNPGELRALATGLGLTGDPASKRGLRRTVPDSDPLVKLGQLLFFSQTLAGGYDVSCGTCHHPDFGGSDGLSISVGVVPQDPSIVGPGRRVDPYRDLDPSADGGPNMHRNSITTFNAALNDRALMFDGRVFVLDDHVSPGGRGQRIRTPESGMAHDVQDLDGLMQLTMKGPIVNDNEMRGFLYADLATPTEYREHLVQRIRGTVDTAYTVHPSAAENWLARFRAAFGKPEGVATELITMPNIQRALAAYIDSKIFVDTPWRRFLEGDDAAIPADAREGARLFLADVADGGLGCNRCHAGDRFSDEQFHNVGIPQLGRGFNFSERFDQGRWFATRKQNDAQAFRTPSLLNVAKTAPYGHTGAFDTLEDLLGYHADPRRGVEHYDFSLAGLGQFRDDRLTYPDAEHYTRDAIARPGFLDAESLLPARPLARGEIRRLVTFLETLTDSCVAEPACISQWTPAGPEDPDGHLTVRGEHRGTPLAVDARRPADYAPRFPVTFPVQPARRTFSDVQDCASNVGYAGNVGRDIFELRTEAGFGLTDRHGYKPHTWFNGQQSTIESTMNAGGVTAAYLDDDCWPDLVFTGGEVSGTRFYRNREGRRFTNMRVVEPRSEREHSGAAVADLNGDYRRELVLGNVKPGSVPIYSPTDQGRYERIIDLPMVRPTYGISFAPLDASGYPYMYMAHWSGGTGTNGYAPALWRFDGGNLYPWDGVARTSSAFVNQKFNFTPKFADFTGDGHIDLVLTSDFSTSNTLRNVQEESGGWHFANETDRDTINDENGMGSALLDVDNDGILEWFVTSVNNTPDKYQENWGISGNRLYRNTSTPGRIAFADVTDQTGVRTGFWGWGACAADFNNDGFIDLFHVNGFGLVPDDVTLSRENRDLQEHYRNVTAESFQGKPPLLFINNADGTFSEQAESWQIAVPSEGRGLVCFDYNRDGDIDIVVFNHSSRLQFFENRGGSDEGRHFLHVRVVGAPPNTDAIGARVHVTADVGAGHGVQTQLRLAEANSNFNSQNPPDLHFGLGKAEIVQEIRVVWPGGRELVCRNLEVNQFLVLDQRDGQDTCPTASGGLLADGLLPGSAVHAAHAAADQPVEAE